MQLLERFILIFSIGFVSTAVTLIDATANTYCWCVKLFVVIIIIIIIIITL